MTKLKGKYCFIPYAHLSNSLSSPETAINILKDTEEQLKKKD